MAKSRQGKKLIGLVLTVVGGGLAIWGYRMSGSFGSRLNEALSGFDLARDGVLERISAPSLIITSDESKLQSVEKASKNRTAGPVRAAQACHSRPTHRSPR